MARSKRNNPRFLLVFSLVLFLIAYIQFFPFKLSSSQKMSTANVDSSDGVEFLRTIPPNMTQWAQALVTPLLDYESAASLYDACIIPGGGSRGIGQVPAWTEARLHLALAAESKFRYFILLSRGTVHRPNPLDGDGRPVDECVAAAQWLVARGIDARRILLEDISLDTVGNAYFTRLLHTEPRKMFRLILITNNFHMRRTRLIFNHVFSLDDSSTVLRYIAAPDIGFESRAQLLARYERENASFDRLSKSFVARVHSMTELNRFIFEDHAAYAFALTPQTAPPGSDVSNTY